MNKLYFTLLFSIAGAILYRLGGKEGWNTRYRDIGCSLVNLVFCAILGLFAGLIASPVAYFLSFGLHWAGYSAYWGLDEQKWGFWAHGLGISLAVLPIAMITGHWLGFALRVIVNTALITVWSQWTKQADLEECGRGFIANATLPLLLLG